MGSDGAHYTFLAKPKDDLRKDNRMMEAAGGPGTSGAGFGGGGRAGGLAGAPRLSKPPSLNSQPPNNLSIARLPLQGWSTVCLRATRLHGGATCTCGGCSCQGGLDALLGCVYGSRFLCAPASLTPRCCAAGVSWPLWKGLVPMCPALIWDSLLLRACLTRTAGLAPLPLCRAGALLFCP